jgi:hypothetical protein
VAEAGKKLRAFSPCASAQNCALHEGLGGSIMTPIHADLIPVIP